MHIPTFIHLRLLGYSSFYLKTSTFLCFSLGPISYLCIRICKHTNEHTHMYTTSMRRVSRKGTTPAIAFRGQTLTPFPHTYLYNACLHLFRRRLTVLLAWPRHAHHSSPGPTYVYGTQLECFSSEARTHPGVKHPLHVHNFRIATNGR